MWVCARACVFLRERRASVWFKKWSGSRLSAAVIHQCCHLASRESCSCMKIPSNLNAWQWHWWLTLFGINWGGPVTIWWMRGCRHSPAQNQSATKRKLRLLSVDLGKFWWGYSPIRHETQRGRHIDHLIAFTRLGIEKLMQKKPKTTKKTATMILLP